MLILNSLGNDLNVNQYEKTLSTLILVFSMAFPALAKGGSPRMKAFIASYNKEYGHDPESAFAALGYDAMYLMADAIKRAGTVNSKAIRDSLAATKGFVGVTGSVTYQPGQRIPQKTVTIVAIKNGQYTLGAQVCHRRSPRPEEGVRWTAFPRGFAPGALVFPERSAH